ncbi:MAG: type II secretion system protein GspD [Planctomycetota bacterium]|nr:MAG: type II secretion system protein GspD [Planctomycetota bacterium]
MRILPLLLVPLAACRAFEPTIPERMAARGAGRVQTSEVSELAQNQAPGAPRAALPPRDDPAPRVETIAAAAHAPLPRIAGDDKLALEMPGVALEEALRMIAAAAGVNFYFDRIPAATVDAVFPSITLDDALGLLLARNGLTLVEEPVGVYWIKPDDPSEVETALWQLQSANATDVAENLKAVAGTATTLVVDANQNFVMARGPKRELALITQYLARSDRLRRQVLIEARILELTLGEDFELGIQHTIEGGDAGAGTIDFLQKLATSNSQFSLVYDNDTVPITSTLTALSSYTGLNLVSSPRLLVLHGKEAKIDVVTEVPYIQATTSTTVGGSTGSSATTEQVAFKEAGIKLTVTPLVQEGGVVQMKIHQELSEVVDTFNTIPVIEKRTLDTDFSVAHGQTVVLGGLLENRSSEVDKGVPFLMDIPLVGRLFRSDEDSSRRRELLLFLTPRVLSPEEASSLADRYADSYAGKLATTGAPRGERF